MKKKIGILICAVLLVVASVGATLAWLTDEAGPVENTFTVGDVGITLVETTSEYHIVPGTPIDKDPKVTVEEDSEDCYLFVTITEENWPEATEADGTLKVKYAPAAGWIYLDTTVKDGKTVYLYYREVAKADTPATYSVLANDEVTVSDTLTKAEVAEIKAAGAPKLTFKAYVAQKDNLTVEQARALFEL